MTVRILSPEGAVGAETTPLARGLDGLAGRRVAVLDNGKPGAALLMGRIAEQLGSRTGAALAGSHRKRTAATPCEDELLDRIATEADWVLTGTAD